MSQSLQVLTLLFQLLSRVRNVSKAGLVATFVLFFLTVASGPVFADVPPPAVPPAKIADILPVIGNIISFLAPAAAIAFLVMFIVGAFKLITSGGDPKATASARSTFTYAIIGLIVVIASWLILLLVKTLTGVSVTDVKLGF